MTRLSRQADIPTIRAEAAAQPQDEQSALVEREWRRVSRKAGVLTEQGGRGIDR